MQLSEWQASRHGKNRQPSKEAVPIPSFLGIGVPRAGTSWLYAALQHHPKLWLPPIKELHYFDSLADSLDEGFDLPKMSYRVRKHGRQRLKSYLSAPRHFTTSLAWDLRFFFGDGSQEWYVALFTDAARRGYFVGEVTPAYALLPPEIIRNIYNISPRARIILILRDPVSRTWSNLARYAKKHDVSLGRDEIRQRIRNRQNVSRSQYNRMLDNWLDVFPRERVFIGFFEDLADSPREFIDQVYAFLGVERLGAALPRDLVAPVHTGTDAIGEIPDWVFAELANAHEPELRRLRERLGGRAVAWHKRVLKALE